MTVRSIRRINHWTQDEDKLISSIILGEITKGKSAQKAFNKATEMVNLKYNNGRTSEGISYRWHNVLKKNYIKEFQQAKEEGKIARTSLSNTDKTTVQLQPKQQSFDEVDQFISSAKMNDVSQIQIEPNEDASQTVKPVKPITTKAAHSAIKQIEDLKSFIENAAGIQLEIDTLKANLELEINKNKELTEYNEALEKANASLEKRNLQLEEDYGAVLKVINKAREITVNEDSPFKEKSQANQFKMERNGNLERV